jgi:L-ascorbate metabolism protein UlaG (beta-lactamase superfamily)
MRLLCFQAKRCAWKPFERTLPDAAARAARMLGVRQVVPMHYGTFPLLTGRPEDLKRLVDPHGIDVLVLKPGETAA